MKFKTIEFFVPMGSVMDSTRALLLSRVDYQTRSTNAGIIVTIFKQDYAFYSWWLKSLQTP